jgi:hypothetical protein
LSVIGPVQAAGGGIRRPAPFRASAVPYVAVVALLLAPAEVCCAAVEDRGRLQVQLYRETMPPAGRRFTEGRRVRWAPRILTAITEFGRGGGFGGTDKKNAPRSPKLRHLRDPPLSG